MADPVASSGHWSSPLERDYKAFWVHAKEVSQLFKSLNPLLREDRERIWEHFSSSCEQAKSAQQTASGNRRFKSGKHKDRIIGEAERARPFGMPNPTAQELKDLGEVVRHASSLLSEFKDEMLGEDKQECFARIQEVRELHDLYWREIKKEASRHQEEYRARVKANLERNYDRYRKVTEALQRLRDHADELREKISSAWNDDFRDRACRWLSETEDKIRDIESSLMRGPNHCRAV